MREGQVFTFSGNLLITFRSSILILSTDLRRCERQSHTTEKDTSFTIFIYLERSSRSVQVTRHCKSLVEESKTLYVN